MQKLLQKPSAGRWHALARQLKKISGATALGGALMFGSNLCSSQVNAQSIVNNYAFSASGGTYTPLGASATAVSALLADDAVSGQIPLGFTFNFDGTNYTNVYVSSNGFLSFNASISSTATNNLATSAAGIRPVLAPLWDDLDGRATGTSKASYETTGTAGSRIFTFEWDKWEWNYTSSSPVISFQVKLYEGSNKIEFIYQQESGAVTIGTTNGASIGIAGTGTGAGNFISLNNTTATPVASYTTETTGINAKPATGQIYTFNKLSAANDVTVTGLASSVPTTGCFGPNQTISYTIKNNGTAPLNLATDPVTVTSSVTGTNATTFPNVVVNTGTIAPGATMNVVVSTTYNMSTAGTYTFNASATTQGEVFTPNDVLLIPATRTVSATAAAAPVTLPQFVDFTGFTGSNLTTVFPNWKESTGSPTPTGTTSAWTSSATSQTTALGSTTAKLNFVTSTTSRMEWIIGPKITPTATSVVSFKAAVTSSAGTATATMLPTDSVNVMVSTDCGFTFTKIGSVSGSNNLTNALTDFSFPLSSYAGQKIIVALLGKTGTPRPTAAYDFHIDNLFLGTPPSVDMGATAFVTPITTKCFTNSEPVVITIQNFHASPIDFSQDNTIVSVKVTGAVNTTLTTTLNTGTLASGATQNVTVGNLNMSAVGNYNLKAYAKVTGDNIVINDTARTSRTVFPVVSLPQENNFTGFTGANLNAVYPNWDEAVGTTPVRGNSVWLQSTSLGTSNTTARINLYTNSRNEWIMGPRVLATANTSLRFKAAITNWNSSAVDPDGMQGTDDKVQVMVSTNCGETFTPVYTFDSTTTATLTNVLTERIISLGAYAGQEIIVAFYATDGPIDNTPDYDFHIDDLYIGTVAPIDLQARALVSPVPFAGCFGTQNVSVRIRNFGTSPLDFTTTNATVSVAVTGAATQTLTATLNNNSLNGGNPLAVEGELVVPVGTLNMTTSGAYTFTASATATGDGNTANDAIPAVNITANPVVAGTASATNANVCIGSSATLNLTGNTGGNIQWQQATSATGPFTDITGATAATFTTTTGINQPTYFQAVVSCGTTTVTSNVVTVNITDPQIATTTPASRCGSGVVSLGATATGNGTISWYNAATGGTPLASGTTYSPNVTATTTFYAEANEGGTTTNIGKASTPGTDGVNSGGGLIFDAINPFVLNSVVVYTNLASGGNLTIHLKNAAGTTLQSATFALPGVSSMTAVTVPLNFNVPAGTGMRLEQGSTLNLYRDYTSVPFPYSSPSTGVTITNGTLAGYYYFFYNWSVTTGCRSARTPVVATVNPVPVVNLGANQNVCGATSTVLNAGNPGATFQWSFNGAPIAGATSQTYTATANGTYAVNVTNATSCSGSDTVQVVFNTKPAMPTLTAGGPTSFCQGGAVVLTGASATPGVTYSWLQNNTLISGATAATYNATNNGSYRVVVTNTAGCTDTSASTTVTVNPIPAMPTVTPAGSTAICQSQSLVLTGASTTTGVTYAWLLNGTAITGATSATYTASVAGSYSVVATGVGGCSDTSAVTTVTVNTVPTAPTIAVSGATTFCDGDSVVLTGASTTTGVTYQWLLNGTAVTGATSATLSALTAGNYSIVAMNASGCSDTSTVTAVTVNPTPATPTITRSGPAGQTLTSSAATGNQWLLNGQPISGATAQIYQTAANGNYAVVVTNTNGCSSDTSAVVNITNTGIKGDFAGMSVSVYPNPSNGKFNVKLTGYKHEAALELYSLTGQLIVKENVKAGQEVTSMQVENLAAGTYLLKVVSEQGVQVSKLIVE